MDQILQNIHLDWFSCTIIFTIFYGGVNFMYKVAAMHNCPAHQVVNRAAATISVLSLLIIVFTGSEFVDIKSILFFAVINSAFFGLGSIVKIKALERIPSSIAFPVTKLNSVFLITYALVLFNDKPTWQQWLGILISLSMLAYISINIKDKSNKVKEEHSNPKIQIWGLLFAVLAAFSTSISMLTGKFASTEVPKLNYIFVSYTLVMIYTFVINKTLYAKKKVQNDTVTKRKTLLFGMVIGVLNFAGYFLVLNAFATGPLSLIQGISSNSFIIPIVLSVIFYRENFNYKKAIVFAMAIISILLIKM